MYAAMMFGGKNFDISRLEATATRIESVLLDQSPVAVVRATNMIITSNHNQLPRQSWIVTTLWIAQYYIRVDNATRAAYYIDWSIQHSMSSGVLPEQVNPSNGAPISVSPLVWSHAELVNTILDLAKL